MKARPMAERFWEKVHVKSPFPEDCWEWSAYKMANGYGKFTTVRGTSMLAHRVSHTLTNGPIPPGMEIDHACHNRACVRPGHLSLVEPAYNSAQGGAIVRNKKFCRNGHEYAVVGTYPHVGGRRRCRACVKLTNKRNAATIKAKNAERYRQNREARLEQARAIYAAKANNK